MLDRYRTARFSLGAAKRAARTARAEGHSPEAVAAADAWVTRARSQAPWWARIDIELTNR